MLPQLASPPAHCVLLEHFPPQMPPSLVINAQLDFMRLLQGAQTAHSVTWAPTQLLPVLLAAVSAREENLVQSRGLIAIHVRRESSAILVLQFAQAVTIQKGL